jgi:hypothetical protein
MGGLGDHDLDLPYEPVGGDPIERALADMVIAGGLTVGAAMVDVPHLGKKPVVIFTFVQVDGRPVQPIAFIQDADQMRKLRPLLNSAVADACKAAES